jgi:hypothetical protein
MRDKLLAILILWQDDGDTERFYDVITTDAVVGPDRGHKWELTVVPIFFTVLRWLS